MYIKALGFRHHAVWDVLAEVKRGSHVDLAAEHGGELVLHAKELEPGRAAGLEFHQDVDVAPGVKIIA